jgi:enamine deaminase RidA (YjgF/YER057c/UK114 family)
MSRVEQRIRSLGYELPVVPEPIAAFVPSVRVGNLLFVSGQGTMLNGVWQFQGKVGEKYTVGQGYQAAVVAALNCLAVIKSAINDLDEVRRVVKLLGWVNSAPSFTQQPYVIDGASQLLEKVFGEKGKHARSAVSAHELPFDTTVEIEMIVELTDTAGGEKGESA